MLPLLLAMLAAGRPEPLSIYIGQEVPDGSVEVDKGIQDSIQDIREEVGRCPEPTFPWWSRPACEDSPLRLVADEQAADVRLYVLRRRTGPTVSTPGRSSARHVETVLRFGAYERPFVAEDLKQKWRQCARVIAKDVSAWLEANRERIVDSRRARER
jgi:hypothetical protein